MKTNEQIEKEAVEEGYRLYSRMLDLDDADTEDAVRSGMRAAAVHALEQAETR